MHRTVAATTLTALITLVSPAQADDYYSIRVTRKASDLYKVDGTALYIRTRYCHEYAVGDKAILVWKGKGEYVGNQLMFIGYDGKTKTSCDVAALLQETTP